MKNPLLHRRIVTFWAKEELSLTSLALKAVSDTSEVFVSESECEVFEVDDFHRHAPAIVIEHLYPGLSASETPGELSDLMASAEVVLNETCGDPYPDQTIRVSAAALERLRNSLLRIRPNAL